MKDSFILGAAVPGEASETMVELCFWPSIVLVCKLAINCDYIWYILRTTDFCTGATKEGKNVKPTVTPSKSHSAAVFIKKHDGSKSSFADLKNKMQLHCGEGQTQVRTCPVLRKAQLIPFSEQAAP
jgi:hypothetical protein